MQLAQGGFIIRRKVNGNWERTGFAWATNQSGYLHEYYVLASENHPTTAPSVFQYQPPGQGIDDQIQVQREPDLCVEDLDEFLTAVDALLPHGKWTYIEAPTMVKPAPFP